MGIPGPSLPRKGKPLMHMFDPVKYSKEENTYLLSHLGEPPVVALRGVEKGGAVNYNAVKPILDRVYELQELEKHEGQTWVGVEALKGAITIYLEKAIRWHADHKRGAPRFPSMSQWDGRGRPHYQGPGSDVGTVKTYFDSTGKRQSFAVELIPSGQTEWRPDWVKADAPDEKGGLKLDSEKNRFECLICNHTESFKPESRSSYSAARARMSKHLRTAKVEVDAHRELHTNEFGS